METECPVAYRRFFDPATLGYARFVVISARRLHRRFPEARVSDLVSVGAAELWRCRCRWAQDGRATFRTYAFPRIRWALMAEVRMVLGWKHSAAKFTTKEGPLYIGRIRSKHNAEAVSDARLTLDKIVLLAKEHGLREGEQEIVYEMYESMRDASYIANRHGLSTTELNVVRSRVLAAYRRAAGGTNG